MTNPWFRLYSEFATDPKIQYLSETLQRRYIMFLCVSCNGDIEKLSDEELAFAFRISLEEFEETRLTFQKRGLIDQSGRVTNWKKRQYLSDSSTSRVRKCRDNKKIENETLLKRQGNVSVTPPDTDTDTDTEELKELKEKIVNKKSSDHIALRCADLSPLYPLVDCSTVEAKVLAWAEKHPDRRHDDLHVEQAIIAVLAKAQDQAERKAMVSECFEEAWAAYPKKDGDKKKAQAKIARQFATDQDLGNLRKALKNYLEHVRLEREGGFPGLNYKGRATWFNNWTEWVEWEAPAATAAPPRQKGPSATIDKLNAFAMGEIDEPELGRPFDGGGLGAEDGRGNVRQIAAYAAAGGAILPRK